ncbi:hypothetical protein T552_00412 [Pneumocystis carinii B80]|uniref:DNA helicase n=1 Tax=Pneumocystis carinii (strain B80) TaxID=1408658 RepID=A0A0W4ZQQ6_PNEC8|nr:hypothetical protein T552_00412 [Pneumocystis carinii B80]KTW30700.1 hypothetical protein T552_00412 [Pneumocystis carinii B80]
MTVSKNKKRCIDLTEYVEEPLKREDDSVIQVACSSPISISSFLGENHPTSKNIDNLTLYTEENKDLIQKTNLIHKRDRNEDKMVDTTGPSCSLPVENNFNKVYQEKVEDTTFVVKESPIEKFKEYTSQFAYQKKGNVNVETKEMMQKPSVDGHANLSNGYLIQKAPQAKSEREKKIESAAFQKKKDFLRRIYPHLPEYVLENMLLKPLTSSTLTSSTSSGFNNTTELTNLENVDITNLKSSPIGVQEKITSKRTLQHSRYTIREKHINSTQNQNYVTPVHTTNKFVQKKRLIRGISRTKNQKDSFSESDDSSVSNEDVNDNSQLEEETLEFLNQKSAKEIADLANCTLEIAEEIIESRPFKNIDSVKEIRSKCKTDEKDRRKEKKTLGMKVLESCMEMLEGYKAIDSLISKCDELGKSISKSISNWGLKIAPEIGELSIGSDDIDKIQINDQEYINQQPNLIPDTVKLKRYQLFGVNWLNLLYRKKLSGILADEMGLGKTCQIIAFFAHLLELGKTGPHLIVVPASTLENWLRELAKFCPSLKVEPYYGTQNERLDIRYHLEENPDYNIIITTYQLATGSKEDRTFLRRQRFDVCVYDEGHFLKNSLSERYKHLMNINANFRLLLTGTPLQNNLKELISLLFFILPTLFSENIEKLITVFKIKTINDGNSGSTLLSEQRIMRAKSMMTPFVLRRKKIHVLNDLPKKIQHIEFCEMNKEQQSIYDECIFTQKKSVEERAAGIESKNDGKRTYNILMQLRKATNHPLLFRRIYNNVILKKIAKNIMKEPDYQNANQNYIYEDMEVMTDFEIHQLCKKFPSIQSFALKGTPWMNSGKVEKLKYILMEAKERGNKVLLFSQFVETLNILEEVLETLNIAFTRLDGRTSVDTRQDIIDQFTDESDITVFLLSTKAGGFGINLSCANIVILYDGSFNPHDDKQAEDRAHRVGQIKEVHVIRLVTKNTIEEYIQSLANTKLALDSSVCGLDDKQLELKAEIYVKHLLENPSQNFSSHT